MSTLRVEVVYALPGEQALVALRVPAATTAIEAVRRSGLLQRFPALQEQDLDLGVFAEPVAHEQVLRDGDRVEVYRPLLLDPRDGRRRRAGRPDGTRGGTEGQGGRDASRRPADSGR